MLGAEVLSVMLFSGMISRVALGFLSDKIGPIFTLFIGSLLQMLALVFFLPFDSQNSLYIVSLMFGLSQGGIVPAYAMIVRKYLAIIRSWRTSWFSYYGNYCRNGIRRLDVR